MGESALAGSAAPRPSGLLYFAATFARISSAWVAVETFGYASRIIPSPPIT